jgi:multicomponent K+:H+ antiporter subunit A
MSRPLPETVSGFFLEHALPEGGGANVVNVIIVDFRGFDTLGEITVLAVVAITVYAILRRFRPPAEVLRDPNGPERGPMANDMLVPGVLMRWMFPAIGILSLHLLFRGHNLPGGGFVAGITLSVAMILQYMAGGTAWAEARLAIRPLRWIALGLLIALASGSGSLLFAHAFLTSHTVHLRVPLLAEVHVPSALFFDLGVFALVVGATALILIALAHQSTRAHRVQAER